ncbi:hypothetical protein IHQ71_30780 (plasmid) [Rhizobium sp. TH2]|uniref:hypothetical protein n=1 Tax=Rhizobium sp. TH2 TaxID=2775403 RepID=UPI00215793B2|nr:hypothetical protein [Rhizobium sp. TH2]UVC12587.1 hypothetical protein IHQ71_30780 [Rhizobium sp. TH2]
MAEKLSDSTTSSHDGQYEAYPDREGLILRTGDRKRGGSCFVVGPDWKGEKPIAIKQVFISFTSFDLPTSHF